MNTYGLNVYICISGAAALNSSARLLLAVFGAVELLWFTVTDAG